MTSLLLHQHIGQQKCSQDIPGDSGRTCWERRPSCTQCAARPQYQMHACRDISVPRWHCCATQDSGRTHRRQQTTESGHATFAPLYHVCAQLQQGLPNNLCPKISSVYECEYEFNQWNFIVWSLFNYVWFVCFPLYYLHFVFHCTHVQMWYVLNSYILTYVGLLRSRLRTLGTHYHPTLDPAVLWTPSNDTSRPIFSDSLNLMPPAPLYLRTLWRYTNAVIIIIITNALRLSSQTGKWVWHCPL